MKKIIAIMAITLSMLLVGCDNNSKPEGTTAPEQILPTEENKISFDSLWAEAKDINTVFKFNGIECKMLRAGTNMGYIGCDFNEKTIGVRIYIEYSPGLIIDQDNFVVLGKNLEEYTHITADGLDFLGKNRGELGEDINGEPLCGYIRVALPEDQDKYLLRYYKGDGYGYIRFSVEEEWE